MQMILDIQTDKDYDKRTERAKGSFLIEGAK